MFVAADAKYNSGIFHFHKEKGRDAAPDQISLNLKVDDKVLKSIITSLYYPAGPYEFSVISADILGQVYEQFIGKVIRLTAGHRRSSRISPPFARPEEIYYTPSYIVDFMVSRTLNPLLAGKLLGNSQSYAYLILPAVWLVLDQRLPPPFELVFQFYTNNEFRKRPSFLTLAYRSYS